MEEDQEEEEERRKGATVKREGWGTATDSLGSEEVEEDSLRSEEVKEDSLGSEEVEENTAWRVKRWRKTETEE